MKPQNRLVEFANSSFGFVTCFLGVGGAGGGRMMMTTLLRTHLEQYLHTSRFTWYLLYFRDVGLSFVVTKSTSGLCELDIGISEGFRRILEIGLGEAFSGMITTLFRGHPEQYLHKLVRTHHAPLQKHTLLR